MGARGRGVEARAPVGAAPLGRLQLGLGVDHLLRLEGEDNEGGLKADGDERGDERHRRHGAAPTRLNRQVVIIAWVVIVIIAWVVIVIIAWVVIIAGILAAFAKA